MMRSVLVSVALLALVGCTSQSPVKEGPPGPAGPAGADGATGATGERGPQGAVGGTLTIAPLAPNAECPGGGVIVSVSDGGSQAICNGAPGPMGAVGPTGATGPNGVPGASVQLSKLDGGIVCPSGGVTVSLPGGQPLYVCNGIPGPAGAAGPAGATGATGPMGATGAVGPAGPTGPTGAAGTQGLQGLQGLAGPAGPTGAAGPQGPAGAIGAAGPQGAPGVSVVATILPAGSGACPYGGTKLDVGTVTSYACNGAPGAVGPPGAPVSGGGGALPLSWEDGFTFAGYTAGTYAGNLGGLVGANAKCHTEFAGSHLCTEREFQYAGVATPPPGTGAWADDTLFPSGSSAGVSPRDHDYLGQHCSNWTYGLAGGTARFISTTGSVTTAADCAVAHSIACCRSNAAIFRGYTALTSTGNLGGLVGANMKCTAEFPGSHLCSEREYQFAGVPTPPPVDLAWVDDTVFPSGTSLGINPRDHDYLGQHCSNWTYGLAGGSGRSISATGSITTTNDCAIVRSLACCGAP